MVLRDALCEDHWRRWPASEQPGSTSTSRAWYQSSSTITSGGARRQHVLLFRYCCKNSFGGGVSNTFLFGCRPYFSLRFGSRPYFSLWFGSRAYCSLGWVNLYKKFEIEKYTVCGKLILPTKMERHFFYFWHNWLANLHGFANICKLPVSNTFEDMQSKIW